ncbi:hypothetical protein, partial [Nocardia abscessus]|uniref:hypothetical protein n=1 Tax=Nocardia abscessus TaxID=120957 RepID=UPI00245574D0
ALPRSRSARRAARVGRRWPRARGGARRGARPPAGAGGAGRGARGGGAPGPRPPAGGIGAGHDLLRGKGIRLVDHVVAGAARQGPEGEGADRSAARET